MGVVDLAAALIREDTAAANEQRAAGLLIPLLRDAGFVIHSIDLAPGRPNLVAHYRGGGELVLSGHLDTVSISNEGWHSSPLEPVISDGRLFGRGSSDMKGGVASMVLAAIAHTRRTPSARGFSIALTSSEESGCQGAAELARSGLLPVNPILVVGESTANMVKLGHKGASWFRAVALGVAAHGSRPELGVNAITALLRLAHEVAPLTPELRHRHLGSVTSNIGTIRGGTQTNMVPAEAELTIDLRTVPATDTLAFEVGLRALLVDGHVERFLDLPPVWTDDASELAMSVVEVVTGVTGIAQQPAGTAYFTDAALLASSTDPRVVIVGPGDPDQPHTANESCSIARLTESVEVYEALLDAWQAERIGGRMSTSPCA